MMKLCEASTKHLNTGWNMQIKFEAVTAYMPLIKNIVTP